MKIQPIVEGHGEVTALPELLRRLCHEAQVYTLEVGLPIRQHRADLAEEATLRKAVGMARKQEDCAAILVLFDSDDACPKELAPAVQGWAQDEARPIPCAVVLAHREYEAWFLASIESLRGLRGIRADAVSHPDPEAPRGAKHRLEERMGPGHSYVERSDQVAFSARFDLGAAHRACRSFRRLVRAFGLLVSGVGLPLPPWPPPAW
jgi:Domain of unknown function (DUF4276)